MNIILHAAHTNLLIVYMQIANKMGFKKMHLNPNILLAICAWQQHVSNMKRARGNYYRKAE
jgi:hypothetical protein